MAWPMTMSAASCVVLSRPSVKRHVPMAQSCAGDQVQPGFFCHPKNELTKYIQILSSILPADWVFPLFFSFEKDVDTLHRGKGLHRKNDPMNICQRANGDLPQDLLPVDSPCLVDLPMVFSKFSSSHWSFIDDGPRIYIYIYNVYIYIYIYTVYTHTYVYK